MPFSLSEFAVSPRGQRLLRWGIPLLAAATIAVLWAVLLLLLDQEQERIEAEAQARASGQARAYAEHSERTMEQIDQLTRLVGYVYLRDGISAELVDLARKQLANQPGLSVLSIADTQGRLVLSTQENFAGATIAERDYFQRHAADRSAAMSVNPPTFGKLSQRFVVLLTRRLETADGRFAGVAVVSADPAYFASFYTQDVLGPRGSITLFDADGVLRVRRSGDRVWYEGAVPTEWQRRRSYTTSGAFTSGNDFDQRVRYTGWRTLDRYPLTVAVGLDRETELEAHAARRRTLYQFMGGVSTVIGLAFGLLHAVVRRLRAGHRRAVRAQRLFEAATDASLDPFFILEAVRDAAGQVVDFRYRHYNARGMAQLGATGPSMVGRLRSELNPDRRDDRLFPLFVQVIDRGEPVEVEVQFDSPALQRRVLQHQIVPVEDGVAVTTRDVTDLRQQQAAIDAAQDALRASETRLRTLTNNLPALVAHVDAQGRYTYANGQFTTLLGLEPARLVGRHVADVMPDSWDVIRGPMEAALAGKPVQYARDQWVGGELHHFHSHYVPDLAADGTVRGLFGLTFDVTELVRARQYAAAQERRLRSITDALPAMVSHVDAEGRYTFVSAAIGALFGVPPETLVGQRVRDVRAVDYPVLAPYVARVMAGEAVSFEKPGVPERDTADRFYQTDYVPDRDVHGVVRGYFAMTYDVTESRRDALRLAASERRIRTIADSLPALVSHIDAGLRYTFANARVMRLHGGRNVIGRTVMDVRGPSDFAVVEPYMQRALAGEAVTFEKMGDPSLALGARAFEVSFVPDIAPDGRVQGFYSMTFDITDRRNATVRLAESGARIRTITDSIPALVSYVTPEERYAFVNRTFCETVGRAEEELVGLAVRDLVGEAGWAVVGPASAAALAGERVEFVRGGMARGADGVLQPRTYRSTFVPERGSDGRVRGYYGVSFDVTEMEHTRAALVQSESRLRGITDNLPVLISYLDREERLQFANAEFLRWLGLDPGAIRGRPLREVLEPEAYAPRAPMLARALAGERLEFQTERQVDGALRAVHTVYIPDRAADGSVQGVFALSSNVTALKLVELRLAELARVDALTGLRNRRAFDEVLPVALARAHRTGSALALMFLDIDHFKTINDTLGHAGGDAVLTEFARRLAASVRTTDTVARLAGDEFVVVLENLSTRDVAQAVASKIVGQVSAPPFPLADRQLVVTTSIGIAFHAIGAAATTGDALLARADAALYAAKAGGRNRFEFAV